MTLIAWSMLLIWCRKFFLCSVHCITKVSSTYLFHNQDGILTVLRATSSKCLTYILATMQLSRDPLAMPLCVHSTDLQVRNMYYEHRIPDVV